MPPNDLLKIPIVFIENLWLRTRHGTTHDTTSKIFQKITSSDNNDEHTPPLPLTLPEMQHFLAAEFRICKTVLQMLGEGFAVQLEIP